LKRSGYAEKSPLKGTLSAPSVGFPASLHSRQVSTGGDEKRIVTSQTVSKDATARAVFAIRRAALYVWPHERNTSYH
jgi:hypothetical protein